AEDYNHMKDSIVNVQTFFRDNVDGYVIGKQGEMQTYVDNKKAEVSQTVSNFNTQVDAKQKVVQDAMVDSVNQMESKKNNFTTFVNIKEDEVRSIVQEYDS